MESASVARMRCTLILEAREYWIGDVATRRGYCGISVLVRDRVMIVIQAVGELAVVISHQEGRSIASRSMIVHWSCLARAVDGIFLEKRLS